MREPEEWCELEEIYESVDVDYENIESEEDFESRLGDFHNLSLTASDWTVETLQGQILKGNVDLQPSFQRREVWTVEKKSAFIESLILGIPVPQIVLAQKKDSRGKYIVLDGKQRLLSVEGFYEGQYGLQSVSLLPEIKGMKHGELDDEWRDALDNATIRTIRLSGWEKDSVLYTIFHRLNTGSVSLNTQELRSALYPGPFTSFISRYTTEDLTLAKLFNARTNRADFRMRDVELLTRYCGITLKPELFGGNLKSFLDGVTAEMNKADDTGLYRACASSATSSINLYSELYGSLESRVNRSVPPFSLLQDGKIPRFNRAVFDALTFPAKDESVRTVMRGKSDEVTDCLRTVLSSSQFIDACSLSTKTRQSLVRRVDLWSTALTETVGLPVKSLRIDSEGFVSEYELS